MEKVEKAAKVLKEGGLVIFPTETVYGIGCLINDQEAVKKLYSVKQRDKDKPTLVLVKSFEQAKEWVAFNNSAKRLAEAFWPGPLTICLPIIKSVPKAVLGPGNTLGVRVSSNEFIQNLFSRIDMPLLAPSANFQGGKAPKNYHEIDKELISKVNYVVDIEPEAEMPSTIVTFDRQKYNIVREGPISLAKIEEVLESKE